MTAHETHVLHVESVGSGSHVTLLHGFTQTSRTWQSLAHSLARSHACHCVDLPGHGLSTTGTCSLEEIADDIVRSTPPGTLIGYSFGARVALHVALRHPEHVTGLVLVSGTAGIINEEEREQRRTADEALAARIEEIGTEAFLDEWLALPLFAGLTPATNQRSDRLRNSPSGLAQSLRCAGSGTQGPLWNELPNISCDVLIVAGERDAKFVDLARRLHDAIPHSEIRIIANAGHTAHLEAPDEFLEVLRGWLTLHAK